MRSGELDAPSLAHAEAMVRDNVSGDVDGDWSEHGKQRLLTALRLHRQSAAGVTRRAVLVGALLGAAIAAVAYAWKQRNGSRLSYVMTGGLLSENGYVRSNGQGGTYLSFSDGSRVDFQESTRARIATVDPHGAQVVIESGQIAFNVVHRPDAVWRVSAGPYEVRVTGAQFDVYWSSYDETLSVAAYEGSAFVSGPLSPNGVLLPAGQRLTGHEGRLTIETLERVVEASEAPEPSLDLPPDEPSPSASPPPSAVRVAPPGPR